MRCPKCQHQQPDGTAICGGCGLVFEKYYRYHPRPGEPAHLAAQRIRDARAYHRGASARSLRRRTAGVPEGSGLRGLLLPAHHTGGWTALWARAALWAVLLAWGLWFITASIQANDAGRSLWHLVNLPFHEFGHLLFRPFGDWVASLGGTLGQLLMPAVCFGVLLLQTRDPFGASAALWWLGQSFIDIAPYINDARAGELPLLGGNVGRTAPYGFHDWEFILGERGLLAWDHRLAQASHTLGSLIILAALAWGALLLWRQLRELRRLG